MTAGASADDEARRLRERARRLEERAGNFERGAEGERAIAAVLDGLPDGYIVYHDLRLPPPSRANVDHLVVTPNRIVAIDSKNYSNPVTIGTGRGAGKLWTGRRPIDSVGACTWEASVVSETIGLPVDPVMCIIAPSLPSSTFDFEGLRVCSPRRLRDELTSLEGDVIDTEYAAEAIERAFNVLPTQRSTPAVQELGKTSLPQFDSGASRAVRSRRRSIARRQRPRGSLPQWTSSLARTSSRLLLLGVGAVVLLALLPTIMNVVTSAGESAGRHVAENLVQVPRTPSMSAASTTAPAAIAPPTRSAASASCGQIPTSWLLMFSWPGAIPQGAYGYVVSWQQDGGAHVEVTPEAWVDQDWAPVIARVPSDLSATVVTELVDERGVVMSSRSDEFERPATCESG